MATTNPDTDKEKYGLGYQNTVVSAKNQLAWKILKADKRNCDRDT